MIITDRIPTERSAEFVKKDCVRQIVCGGIYMLYNYIIFFIIYKKGRVRRC